MVCYGMVWYGMVWYGRITPSCLDCQKDVRCQVVERFHLIFYFSSYYKDINQKGASILIPDQSVQLSLMLGIFSKFDFKFKCKIILAVLSRFDANTFYKILFKLDSLKLITPLFEFCLSKLFWI